MSAGLMVSRPSSAAISRQRKHKIHAAACDSGPRHTVELSRAWLLREHNACPLFRDGLHPVSSVRSRARKNDRDRGVLAGFGERDKKFVHGFGPHFSRFELQGSPCERHLWYSAESHKRDLDAAESVGNLCHRHRCGFGKDAAQIAFVIGREMLNQDKRHAGVSRKMTEQFDERFQPPADAPTATTGKFRSDPGLRIVSVSPGISWTLLGVLILYCPSSSLLFKENSA